jgi:hypothetical protein
MRKLYCKVITPERKNITGIGSNTDIEVELFYLSKNKPKRKYILHLSWTESQKHFTIIDQEKKEMIISEYFK